MRGRAIAVLVSAAALLLIAGYLWRQKMQPPVPAGAGAAADAPVTAQKLSHGRFENLTVYAPNGAPRGLVILLSGAGGWTEDMAAIAMHLARQGALVAGIDMGQLTAQFESDGADCVFPDGDLENLSHFVQAYYHLPAYLPPILAGKSAGAALVYATLAQAPVNTFAAAVSMQFCPSLSLRKPLCKSFALDYSRNALGGMDLLPAQQLANPWVVLQADGAAPPGTPASDACDVAAVRTFAAKVPAAQFIVAPDGGTGASALSHWAAPYAETFETLLAKSAPPAANVAPQALRDLPLVTIAALPGARSSTFAIILSGDGGWAGLDKEVASALSADGIPVIGLDSLRYFWSARNPEGLAADLDRIIRYYVKQFGMQRVMLIGYSQGADVLPFAVNRLPQATRAQVSLTAIMGMSEHALFEFHVTSWLADDNSGPATLPEVNRITGMPVLCIYGEEESDSLCPKLDPRKVTVVRLKGGHHFDGNYDGLAQTILAAARH